MRVVHLVFQRKKYGGIETYIQVIRRHSRHNHYIVAADHVSYHLPEFYSFYRAFKKCVESLDRRDCDVIHAHFFPAALFAQEKGFNVILTSHSLRSRAFSFALYDCGSHAQRVYARLSQWLYEHYERKFYPMVRSVLAMSTFHIREIEAIGGTAKFMQPIIEPDFGLNSGTLAIRKNLNIPDKLTILFLGRPVYYKGLYVLLAAFQDITQRGVQLVVIGDGFKCANGEFVYVPGIRGPRGETRTVRIPFAGVCQQIIVRAGQPRNVIRHYYRAADIVVCPSLYEPLGYVNLEAMATGRPVIGSNTGGIPEVIQDGVTGLLFEPGNAAELRKKILLLMENDDLRERLGSNGYEFVRRNFDVKRQAEELDCLYEVVAAGESIIGS